MWSKISKRKLNIPLLVGTILCGLFVGFNIHGTKMPRQMSIIQELQGVNRELMQANQKLQPLLQNCNCSNSESLCVRKDDSCVAVGNYKNPCDNQLGIEIQKAKIQSSVNQLALLTRLAKAENESSSVYEQSEKLLEIARRSRDEINNCASPDSCAPNCQPGFGGEICGSVGVTREQVPVELKFGVEAKMQDIEIGPVRISEVGLELPKSIATPDLPALSNIEIETPDVIIEGFEVSASALANAGASGSALEVDATNLGASPIQIDTVNVPTPNLPGFSLTCDNTSSNNVSECSAPEDIDTTVTDDSISKFNDVSEKCKNLFTKEENIFYTEPNPSYIFEGDEYGVGVNAKLTGNQYIDDEISIALIEESSGKVCEAKFDITESNLSTTSPSIILNNINEGLECPDFISTKVKDNQFTAESKTAQEGVIELEKEITIEAKVNQGGPTSTLAIESNTTRMVPSGCFNPEDVFDTIYARCDDFEGSMPPWLGEPDVCSINEDNYNFSEGKEIESKGTNCGGGTINNNPSQPWCNDSIPSVPKIELPDFPGYKVELPDFKLMPLVNIQLPDFIIEELNTPDIELCNLNNCQDIAPNIAFNPKLPGIEAPMITMPQINTPKAKIKVNIPEAEGGGTAYINVKMPEVRTTSFRGPSINLGNLKAPGLDNLFSLAKPKIELPNINVQSPKIDYYFEGPSLDITPGLIIGTLLNAFGVDVSGLGFSACLDIGGALPIPIEFIYEDYIFSWPAFPEMPELDFCSDINQFCSEASHKLGGMKEKINKVEEEIEKAGQNTLGDSFSQVSDVLRQEIENRIQDKISNIESSLSQEIVITEDQYYNLKEGDKFKIPGQRIEVPDITVEGFELEDKINQTAGASYPNEITIPWDQLDPSLQKVDLTTDPIEYEIPDIPLSQLSWKKDISINIPGLQELSLKAQITTGKSQECIGQSPSGNPCNTGVINQNLNELNQVKENLNNL